MAQDSVSRLQQYDAKIQGTDYALCSEGPDVNYVNGINKTLRALQHQVKQHEAALEKLRAIAAAVTVDEPSQDFKPRIEQLRTLTKTYKTLAPTKPLLPLPNSPLPALLALRRTLNEIDQSKATIKKTSRDVKQARARVRWEEYNLREAQAMTQALERKVEVLKIEHQKQSHSNPVDVVNALVRGEQEKREHHATELKRLMKAFNTFVNERLAAMIAAEDLGGPLVGDMANVNEDALKAGFNRKGSSKKAKVNDDTMDDSRQRRNEEIWGPGDEESDEEPRTEKEAAGADFRSLTEDLLNAFAGDEGPYIHIHRESAAVRFLVRAKVAQFHANDARQLRLIDFGKELGG